MRGALWGLLAAASAAFGACAFGVGESRSTALAGFDDATRLEAELNASRARCTACHATDSAPRIAPEEAPRLELVGARKTPEGLRKWLSDPHGAKPGTAMPDLLATLPERERESTLDVLVHYLAAQGGPLRREATAVDLRTLENGRKLFHSVGCVACHEPQESVEDLEAPTWDFDPEHALAPSVAADLGAPAFDTSVDALATFLVAPLAVRPSGRMPSLGLDEREARAIATYLLRGQCNPGELAWASGWEAQYFEFESAPPELDALEVLRTDTVEELERLPEGHRKSLYAYRFRAFVELPASGQVEFVTRSDDGVRLSIDEKLLIDEWHDQAPAEFTASLWLERGRHAVELQFFQNLGGDELALRWKLPDAELAPLPAAAVVHAGLRYEPTPSSFELDPGKVARGRVEFARLGCGACHAIEGREARTAPLRPPTLAQARRALDQGCLSDTPRRGAPHFDFDDRERLALRTLLLDLDGLDAPREARAELHATMSRLSCYACHARGGEGGPDELHRPYFRPTREVDLGDEGRLPPHLDGVGGKLRREALAELLHTGRGVRPYLATRMPVFGEANVHGLAECFARLDGSDLDGVAPDFDAAHIELGRKLAGSKGLGCIQCHSFNGVESLGIPAVDLGVVSARIQPAWFQRLLLDPRTVGMNSRMPILWQEEPNGALASPVKDLLDGDPRAQIDALWSYLSLGASMPIPEGLDTPDSKYELIPSAAPEMCAVFLENASPRGMMVGFPEGVHYAFDVEHSRLAWVWRGRFFNAKGTWYARAGGLERPPAADARKLSGGATFARLAEREGDWPTDVGDDPRYRRLGWRLDAARRPVWRYALEGVEIEEHIAPRVSGGRAVFVREFVLRAPAPVADLRFDPLERQLVSGWKREGEGFVARLSQEVSL
jgi:mono/diheme cytochrome c family protein